MQHPWSLVIFSNKTEPHPTLLFLSNSDATRTWLVSGQRRSGLQSSLNPIDVAAWSILESNACSSYRPIATSLKDKLKHCWDTISPETICAPCNQDTDRLRRVEKAKGDCIEKIN